MEGIAEQHPTLAFMIKDKGPVWQLVHHHIRMAALSKDARHGAFAMQLTVKGRSRPRHIAARPKTSVIRGAAFSAGPVTGGKGHSLVQKEKLGIVPRGHQLPPTALKAEHTAHPILMRPTAFGVQTVSIVQDTAIAHEPTPRGVGDDLSIRLDAVLQRHQRIRSAPSRRITSPLR